MIYYTFSKLHCYGVSLSVGKVMFIADNVTPEFGIT